MESEKIAVIILDDFVLSNDIKTTVRSVNIMFKEAFLDVTALYYDEPPIVWKYQNEDEFCLAKELFNDMLHLYTEDQVKEFIEMGARWMLLGGYEYLFDIHKRHNETLGWIRECKC